MVGNFICSTFKLTTSISEYQNHILESFASCIHDLNLGWLFEMQHIITDNYVLKKIGDTFDLIFNIFSQI